jgi:hypothetical protein
MDTQEPTRSNEVTAVRPSQESGKKLVIKGVITHERLLTAIEQRNPIVANRDKRGGR